MYNSILTVPMHTLRIPNALFLYSSHISTNNQKQEINRLCWTFTSHIFSQICLLFPIKGFQSIHLYLAGMTFMIDMLCWVQIFSAFVRSCLHLSILLNQLHQSSYWLGYSSMNMSTVNGQQQFLLVWSQVAYM